MKKVPGLAVNCLLRYSLEIVFAPEVEFEDTYFIKKIVKLKALSEKILKNEKRKRINYL